MCDEGMDDIELWPENRWVRGTGFVMKTRGDGYRTHLWSQPTICERISYRANVDISRMK